MIKDAKYQRSIPTIWVGHRLSDCFGFHFCLCVYEAICCDYGEGGVIAQREYMMGVDSLEEISYRRRAWTNQNIDMAVASAMAVLAEIKERMAGPALLLPYANTSSIENLALLAGDWMVAAPKAALRHEFDDKIMAMRLFRKLGLPTLVSHVISKKDWSRILPSSFPVVIKIPNASSGHGTFLVSTADEFICVVEQWLPTCDLLCEPFVNGYSLNINAVAFGSSVVCAPASVQLIGLPVCGSGRFLYCGNDFAAALELPIDVRSQCKASAEKIGAAMAARGYRGVFGVDCIVNDAGVVIPIEINARFQNSTALLNRLLSDSGMPTLAEVHVAACLGEKPPVDDLSACKLLFSQIVVHAQHSGEDVYVTTKMDPGIYATSELDNSLSFVKNYVKLSDCREGEVIVDEMVPIVGTVVEENAPLFRLIVPKRVVDASRIEINAETSRIVTVARSKLGLKESVAC